MVTAKFINETPNNNNNNSFPFSNIFVQKKRKTTVIENGNNNNSIPRKEENNEPSMKTQTMSCPDCLCMAKCAEIKMEEVTPLTTEDRNAKKKQKPPPLDKDDKAPVDPRKYKTKLCRNWKVSGSCPYEHTCCYAHGDGELRTMQQNNNALTSLGYFSGLMMKALRVDETVPQPGSFHEPTIHNPYAVPYAPDAYWADVPMLDQAAYTVPDPVLAQEYYAYPGQSATGISPKREQVLDPRDHNASHDQLQKVLHDIMFSNYGRPRRGGRRRTQERLGKPASMPTKVPSNRD